MKEIKAYIRLKKAEEVIRALEKADVPGFTVVEVRALGKAAVPERETLSIEYAEMYSPITKLEVVCNDDESERIVALIRESASTGHRGDGMIFVSDVCCAVKIRTGERCEDGLATGPEKVRPE
ncbi:MAG: P-II family nitrogen regulator [Thermodesulfobacteriota bacterium]